MDTSTPSSSNRPLSFGELFDRSWAPLKKQLPLVAVLSLVFFLGLGAASRISYVGWLLNAPLSAGFIACLIRIRRSEAFDFADFFWAFQNMNRFLNVVLASVLSTIICVMGFVFLIIPGIWISVALSLSTVLLVRGDLDAIGALRKSYDLVKGNWWNVFGVLILVFFLNILGALCFLVGLLVSIPMSWMIFLELAEDLERQKAPPSAEPQAIGSSSFAVNPTSQPE